MRLSNNDGSDFEQRRLICHLCGQPHRAVPLRLGQRASCVRCDSLLTKRNLLGPDVSFAFAITGLILAAPAGMLPLMTVAKWGNERKGFLLTGFTSLWHDGMHLLASVVLLCGVVLPLVLLGTLMATLLAERIPAKGEGEEILRRISTALERWAMPEVSVLAVLVAFFKLGDSVNVTVGPGLWCYTAMSIATLLAWRSFDDPQKSYLLAPPPENMPRSQEVAG